MKQIIVTLVALMAMALPANSMSFKQAQREALFLTDKMAYELDLSPEQYDAAYEINLDYLMGVTSRYDVLGPCWDRRTADFGYILFDWQMALFRATTYFFRPLFWEAGHWHFGVYVHYPHRSHFYFARPTVYHTYRGGHSWHRNDGRSYFEGHRPHPAPRPQADHRGMRHSYDQGNHDRGKNVVPSNDRYGHDGHRNSNRVNVNRGHQVQQRATNPSVQRQSSPSVQRQASPSVQRQSTPSVQKQASPSVQRQAAPSRSGDSRGGRRR